MFISEYQQHYGWTGSAGMKSDAISLQYQPFFQAMINVFTISPCSGGEDGLEL